jgi:tRNA(Ser,Leu) C12 N-acetylase TAN1
MGEEGANQMRNTIEMAREAGLLTWLKPPEDVIERFKAFEDLVRADEREACAKVCEALNKYMDDGEECAAAIRNRGNT